MYDPIETELSYTYLKKIREEARNLSWAILGGWAVFLHVRKEYEQAFGQSYLASRDIDVFVHAGNDLAFYNVIKKMGFQPSAYAFRYELIYDREEKKLITGQEARQQHLFHLVYIFLDIFSNKETKKLGSWVFSSLDRIKIAQLGEFPVLPLDVLLSLKVTSFFEREKLDKELKDACDIYALLHYAGKKVKKTYEIQQAAQKVLQRPDLQLYIAQNVLLDGLKASLVVTSMRRFSD